MAGINVQCNAVSKFHPLNVLSVILPLVGHKYVPSFLLAAHDLGLFENEDYVFIMVLLLSTEEKRDVSHKIIRIICG